MACSWASKISGAWALRQIAEATGADAVGVDWHTSPAEARAATASLSHGRAVSLQGNLDPALLGAPAKVLAAHVSDVVDRGREAPAHVLNLGHGVPPETDPDVLTRIVEQVHGELATA